MFQEFLQNSRRQGWQRIMIDEWARSGDYFKWRGHNIFFRSEGDGAPLLLIHGVPTASWVWHGVWPALASRYRLIAPDLAGFGLSDKPTQFAYTVMSQADLCQGLLAHCGVRDCHILAENYGDTIAQELLARDTAGTIASACLLNGGIFPEAHRTLLMQKLIASRFGRPFAALVMRRPFQRSLSRFFGPETKPSADTLDALWTLLCRNKGRAIMPQMMAYRADRDEYRDRWVNALVQSRVPLCFVFGTHDPVCGREMVDLWRARVPGGDVVELPGIGHFPALEAPADVAEAYLAFRRAHDPLFA
jgi:pimeloyl-ACP methyl ester carboxylesterase